MSKVLRLVTSGVLKNRRHEGIRLYPQLVLLPRGTSAFHWLTLVHVATGTLLHRTIFNILEFVSDARVLRHTV